MWNNFIDNGVFEFEVGFFFQWCKFDLYVFVLIFIIRLMNKFFLGGNLFSEGFMVGNLWFINCNFGVEFMVKMFNDDV